MLAQPAMTVRRRAAGLGPHLVHLAAVIPIEAPPRAGQRGYGGRWYRREPGQWLCPPDFHSGLHPTVPVPGPATCTRCKAAAAKYGIEVVSEHTVARRRVRQLLTQHPEWPAALIAEKCGGMPATWTVSKIRQELVAARKIHRHYSNPGLSELLCHSPSCWCGGQGTAETTPWIDDPIWWEGGPVAMLLQCGHQWLAMSGAARPQAGELVYCFRCADWVKVAPLGPPPL